MDAGKIAAITGGVVSFVVVGGLLLMNRHRFFKKSSPRSRSASLTNEGIRENTPEGNTIDLKLEGPSDNGDSAYYELGGKRRRTRRKKNSRK